MAKYSPASRQNDRGGSDDLTDSLMRIRGYIYAVTGALLLKPSNL